MKSFTDYLNEKMNSHDDCDELVEGCGCDGTNEDVSSKDAGRIGAAISNRKDLPASEKNVARRSLQRKVAKAKRREKAFNVNSDSGSRYRVGTKRPTDDTDPKHKGLRRNDAIAKTLKSYGTNEDVEQVDEACWDTHVQRGTKMKGGKVVPNCVPRNEGTEEQVDEVMTGTRDPQGSHRHTYQKSGKGGMSLAALRARRKEQEDNNPTPEKNKSNEEVSVEEAKKKIKVKLDPKKKIGYEVRSVGPGGKTTVTKRRDMPDKEDIGEGIKDRVSRYIKSFGPEDKMDKKDRILAQQARTQKGSKSRVAGTGILRNVKAAKLKKQRGETNEASGAWQRKEGKNKEGGLNAAGRASYERENPGSDLKAPVSSKTASKNPDGKAAKRRKSFCARMGGMKGAMKDEKGRPTRKALALRKWDC